MRLHYFVKANADGFQVQESQESYGGEHDDPAEFEEGQVVTYPGLELARRAAVRCFNEATHQAAGSAWRVTLDVTSPVAAARV